MRFYSSFPQAGTLHYFAPENSLKHACESNFRTYLRNLSTHKFCHLQTNDFHRTKQIINAWKWLHNLSACEIVCYIELSKEKEFKLQFHWNLKHKIIVPRCSYDQCIRTDIQCIRTNIQMSILLNQYNRQRTFQSKQLIVYFLVLFLMRYHHFW